jgi:hypothetical protein
MPLSSGDRMILKSVSASMRNDSGTFDQPIPVPMDTSNLADIWCFFPSLTDSNSEIFFCGALYNQYYQSDLYVAIKKSKSSTTYDSIRPISELNKKDKPDVSPWISGDGLHLYYISLDSANQVRLLFSRRDSVNDTFTSPIPVLPFIPGIYSSWLTPDEKELYYCVNDFVLVHATRNSLDDDFKNHDTVEIPFSTLNSLSVSGFSKHDSLSFLSIQVDTVTAMIVAFTNDQLTNRICPISRNNLQIRKAGRMVYYNFLGREVNCYNKRNPQSIIIRSDGKTVAKKVNLKIK